MADTDLSFRIRLEAAKRENLAQLLFKCARLWNEEALGRMRDRTGQPLRQSHTLLLPHIDLAGTRLTTLAERLGCTKQAVGQLVEELEAMGVVERTPDPDDGRAKLVRFSAKGRAGLLQGLSLLTEIEGELARTLGRPKLKKLRGLLAELLPVLQARATQTE